MISQAGHETVASPERAGALAQQALHSPLIAQRILDHLPAVADWVTYARLDRCTQQLVGPVLRLRHGVAQAAQAYGAYRAGAALAPEHLPRYGRHPARAAIAAPPAHAPAALHADRAQRRTWLHAELAARQVENDGEALLEAEHFAPLSDGERTALAIELRRAVAQDNVTASRRFLTFAACNPHATAPFAELFAGAAAAGSTDSVPNVKRLLHVAARAGNAPAIEAVADHLFEAGIRTAGPQDPALARRDYLIHAAMRSGDHAAIAAVLIRQAREPHPRYTIPGAETVWLSDPAEARWCVGTPLPRTPLHMAIEQHDDALCEQLLAELTPEMDARHSFAAFAAWRGTPTILTRLLDHQAVGMQALRDEAVWCWAVRSNNPALLSAFLGHPRGKAAAVEYSGNLQRSIWHKANNEGMTVIAEAMLALPTTKVNAIDNIGQTALHYACRRNDRAFTGLLLNHDGLELNARQLHPLLVFTTAQENAADGALLEDLLTHPRVVACFGSRIAADYSAQIFRAAFHRRDQSLDVLRSLLRSPLLGVERRAGCGIPPLQQFLVGENHAAIALMLNSYDRSAFAENNSADAVLLRIIDRYQAATAGIPPPARVASQMPLHQAVRAGDAEATALLLATPSSSAVIIDEDGFAAIHRAVLNNDVPVLREFLRANRDLNAVSRDGYLPWQLADIAAGPQVQALLNGANHGYQPIN